MFCSGYICCYCVLMLAVLALISVPFEECLARSIIDSVDTFQVLRPTYFQINLPVLFLFEAVVVWGDISFIVTALHRSISDWLSWSTYYILYFSQLCRPQPQILAVIGSNNHGCRWLYFCLEMYWEPKFSNTLPSSFLWQALALITPSVSCVLDVFQHTANWLVLLGFFPIYVLRAVLFYSAYLRKVRSQGFTGSTSRILCLIFWLAGFSVLAWEMIHRLLWWAVYHVRYSSRDFDFKALLNIQISNVWTSLLGNFQI